MSAHFVDRDEDLADLRAMAAALSEGRGGAVLIEGPSGMGKSSLLARFAAEAASESRVVVAQCLPTVGTGMTYGPVVEILLALSRGTRRPGRLRRMFGAAARGVDQSAPDALSAIVPGLGAAWTMGRQITEAALRSGSMPFDSLLPFQQGAVVRIADALVAAARPGAPVLVMIDDIQFIDPSSLQVLDLVLRRIAREPLAIVLSLRTDTSAPGATTVRNVTRTWSEGGLLGRRRLTGLPQQAVAELVGLRYPSAPPDLPARLRGMTDGHPLFVSLCLDEWRERDGTRLTMPDSLTAIVEERLSALDPGDRRLLELASVQGAAFVSRTLAEIAGEPHELVVERLREIARTRLIVLEKGLPEWAAGEMADGYRFEHHALWEVVYKLMTPEQRRSRHARTAAVLTAGGGEQPLGRLLEIARHLDLGGPPCREASADAHYALARSAAVEGLSFAEAERHCETAIAAIRALPAGSPERDRRLVEAVELLLSLTEVRWRGQHQEAGPPHVDIDRLAAEAEQAAARCGSPALIAHTALLRGKTLMATRGLEPSLAKLREAVDLAAKLGDPVALFVATVEYGRQVSKRDLAEGLRRLREAERMYAAEQALGGGGDPVLQHARNLGEMQLGITLFDSGYLGEALSRLTRCAARLRDEPLNAELPIALNYLAQIQAGLGLWRAAEDSLREALAFEAERGGDSGWHAYNAALLAWALADRPEGRAESLELIARAWEETQRTWLANLVPIVRNLYVEVLLASADGRAEALDQADRLAGDTCVETRRTGMVRSEIAAYSLRGRIRLSRANATAARSFADEALRLLDEVGDMPALRTEEVLFHAAEAMYADGAQAEAEALLERARAAVSRKAGHIDDPDLRRSFLDDVPLNRRVFADQPFDPGG